MSGTLLLTNQYIHILNNDSGIVRMEQGPKRCVLASSEEQIGGVQNAVILKDGTYGIINNPYDEKTGKQLVGETIVVIGPRVVCLRYKETLSNITNVHILQTNQALRLRAIADHDNKKAGECWQIEGPCSYIPNKFTRVLKTIHPINILEKQGIYVINTASSEKKLVSGPCSYLLSAEEELYQRVYNDDECRALRISNQPSANATVINLEKGEVVCIVDEKRNEKCIAGPNTILLKPDETVKVLTLAAGVPKKARTVRVAAVRTGPDFFYDKFEVRTSDNANLSLTLAYEWQFMTDPEEYQLIFSMVDFVGYAAMTLCALIREEAAKHTFEEFHKNCADILHASVFKEHEISFEGKKNKFTGLYFSEIKLLISKIDVKKFNPVNPEINDLLNESIKSNMIIFCNKMEQEAQFKSQKEKIKTDAELQALRQQLIDTMNENMSLEVIEKAKIDGKAKLCSAVADKQIEDLTIMSDISLKMKRMKSEIELLNTPVGERYLELLRVKNLANVPQSWFVSSESKIALPVEK